MPFPEARDHKRGFPPVLQVLRTEAFLKFSFLNQLMASCRVLFARIPYQWLAVGKFLPRQDILAHIVNYESHHETESHVSNH